MEIEQNMQLPVVSCKQVLPGQSKGVNTYQFVNNDLDSREIFEREGLFNVLEYCPKHFK